MPESGLTDEQMQVIEDAIRNDPRFLSGGARRYFRRVWLGYAILAVAGIIGIWAFSNKAANDVKDQINHLSSISCISSIKTYHKFNDLVEGAIQAQREAKKLNLKVGDKSRAALNQKAIDRYKADKIVPPTPKICSNPVLK